MDASQYKDNVLVLLFVKYVSDKYDGQMYRFMPQWRVYRDALNRLPVRHEDWVY